MRGLHAATSFFTVIPVPPVPVDPLTTRRATAWFPVLGALLGMAAATIAVAASIAGAPALGVIGGLAVLAAATGGLHLDGIADTADALGSRKPAADALAIMKRSDIGPMGVAALVLVVLMEAAALSAQPGWQALAAALVLGPATGRAVILEAARPDVPLARPGGFGSLFANASSTVRMWVGDITLVVLSCAAGFALRGIPLGIAWAAATALALVAGRLWRGRMTRHFGGMTGDLYGSTIELTTATFWVLVALTGRI